MIDHEEMELLREENRLLRQRVGLDTDRSFIALCKDRFGTTPGEARVLNGLLRNRTPSKEALMSCYTNDALDEPDIKIVDVAIHRLRRKLGYLVNIETIWGVGYRLPDDEKSKLLASLGTSEAA